MNDKYKSINCPICDKSLENSDVVVCPDCGAPYHRNCYLQEKQCIFPELHASGNDWKAPKSMLEGDTANSVPVEKLENTINSCTRCGTVNPPQGVFCQICGNKLPEKPTTIDNQETFPRENDFPQDKFEPSKNYTPPDGIPLNSIMNPLGGLTPDETIDDVPVKELAVFVGRGSHYYLPKFKELSQNRGKSLNLGAFIFTGGFFLYRKMFMLGLLFCGFDILFSIPSSILLYEQMTSQMISGTQLIASNQSVTNLESICSMLILVLRCVCGFFANNLYKNHVFKKIKEIKSTNLQESEYFKTLAKQGSVAMLLIRLLVGFYVTFYFIFILMMLV